MARETPDHLDLSDPRNYVRYLVGMAFETAAVVVLMIIAFVISYLGLRIW